MNRHRNCAETGVYISVMAFVTTAQSQNLFCRICEQSLDVSYLWYKHCWFFCEKGLVALLAAIHTPRMEGMGLMLASNEQHISVIYI